MFRAINAIINAAVPELVETAKSTVQYFANSSSNFRTLSPKTNLSFHIASTAAFSISFVNEGLARGILETCISSDYSILAYFGGGSFMQTQLTVGHLSKRKFIFLQSPSYLIPL
jgi:hypothetical protein